MVDLEVGYACLRRRLIRRASCARHSLFDRFIGDLLGGHLGFAFAADVVQFLVGQVLDANERISSCAGANEFVQLNLNGGIVPVL
jgi:hypothetical protein